LEYLSLLLIPLVGAVIGYSTNLLAITMLFRPHRQLKVFGRRLPFTPGLVPRQQRQLAQKMGASLSENILTSEALVEAATNSGIVDNVVNMVQGFVDNIVQSDDSLSKILADLLKRDEEELVRDLVQNSEKFVGKTIAMAREYAENKALPYLHSQEFAKLLTDFADTALTNVENSGKKLAEVIPSGVAANIKSAARDNMHRLAPACRKLLADDRVDARLRELVGKVAKENASGLLGLFVNGDKIYDSIVQNLLKYLDDEENHALICEKLDALVDDALEKELGWVIGKLNRQQTENWLATAVAAIQKNLRQEHVNKIFDGISRSVSPEKAMVYLFSLKPKQIPLLGGVPEGRGGHTIDKLIRRTITTLAQKANRHIVGTLDIAKIAEERINAFDTQEMERLVKTVAGVQLKWIMLLGGLLGFIMGFFPAIFSLLF